MAPRSRAAATEVAETPATDYPTESNDGPTPPPYDAKWLDVPSAAKLASVTSQTIRNAYSKHEAFNPDGGTPAWFTTKMIDQFGNVTGYDAVYLDHAAVMRWINARARGAATTHSGAKRRIVRITDAQIAAQPTITRGDGQEVPAIALADGTMIELEVPPMGNRKAKSTTAEHTNGTAPEGINVAQSDLFNVDLVEA